VPRPKPLSVGRERPEAPVMGEASREDSFTTNFREGEKRGKKILPSGLKKVFSPEGGEKKKS